MTDDEFAFIRAATVEPDEDTLRLVYADWLDEQGGGAFASHAAFVRLQVRRARTDVFDPVRADLLEQEAACLRKHKRDWNGRVHRHLMRVGFAGQVDARRGLIRGWDYHRGMIAHVTAPAETLTTHADLVFALGPIESLRLATWPVAGWEQGAAQTLKNLLPRLKVVSLVGAYLNSSLPLVSLEPFAAVPLLDLRSAGIGFRPAELYSLARARAIPPVVLYRWAVSVTRPQGGPRGYPQESRTEVHVMDPHGKWNALRLGFASLTGEVLSPIRYQGTSR